MPKKEKATETEKETLRITRRPTTAPKRAKASAAAPLALALDHSHDAIARRAYELFEERGGLHGFHLEDWLRAEAELTARS